MIFKNRICVIDTETTGFPGEEWSGVCELGAVVIGRDGQEIASVETLVRPPIFDSRADKALTVNRIPREEIEAAPHAADVGPWFVSWLQWAATDAGIEPDPSGSVSLTSFNVAFDRPMLIRLGIGAQAWGGCVMLAASRVMGKAGKLPVRATGRRGEIEYRWPKLVDAASFFGVPVVGAAHRALTDARTAAGIMVEIAKMEGK